MREAVTYRDTGPTSTSSVRQTTSRKFGEHLRSVSGRCGVSRRFFYLANTYLFVGDFKYWLMSDYHDIDPH